MLDVYTPALARAHTHAQPDQTEIVFIYYSIIFYCTHSGKHTLFRIQISQTLTLSAHIILLLRCIRFAGGSYAKLIPHLIAQQRALAAVRRALPVQGGCEQITKYEAIP